MMESSTPQRSNSSQSSTQNANFTRPQEPESPTNLNRTSKRHQRELNVNPPPRLDLGGSARNCTTASKAISGQLEALEREARIQRTVMNDLAATVDSFVSAYHNEERKFAQDLCNKIVHYLTNSVFAERNNFIPIRVQSQPSGTPTSTPAKSVSFADMAKTLQNSGADFRQPRSALASSSGSRPTTTNSGGASLTPSRLTSTNGSAKSSAKGHETSKREDRRLLVPVEPAALLNRPEPFALRQELAAKIDGITLASIPLVTPTKTGWAITPSDLTTRDLLCTQENTEIILRTFCGTAVKQPETWYNYAVPGVPSGIHCLGGTWIHTAEVIDDEVIAQTTERPVSCRPSRHGANPETGKTTWIVSFLAPVKAFRLFNTSELSKPIDKKAAISRHDPGCQGFCNPNNCTRYSRCNHCSTRLDLHAGPSGANCIEKARCANCHGPFPAGHEHCPATPRRKNGKIIKPTKKELDTIRRHGDREYQALHAPPPGTEQLQPQAQSPEINVTTSRKRKGATVTAHETSKGPSASSQASSASSQASSASSQASSASSQAPSASSSQASTSAPPTGSRPHRVTATGKNLNLAKLSAQSMEANGMDIDSQPSC
jgi:hypothetical protein